MIFELILEMYTESGWWFQIFIIFTPTWGNDPILTNIFQMGWNHQLGMHVFVHYMFYLHWNIPGSSFTQKNSPKGKQSTCLEDPGIWFVHVNSSDCDCVWAYTVGKCAPGQAPRIKKTASDWTETIIRWSHITIRGEFPPIPHKINKASFFVKGAGCKMIYGVSKNPSSNCRSAKPMPQAVGSFHRREVNSKIAPK